MVWHQHGRIIYIHILAIYNKIIVTKPILPVRFVSFNELRKIQLAQLHPQHQEASRTSSSSHELGRKRALLLHQFTNCLLEETKGLNTLETAVTHARILITPGQWPHQWNAATERSSGPRGCLASTSGEQSSDTIGYNQLGYVQLVASLGISQETTTIKEMSRGCLYRLISHNTEICTA